MTKKTWPEHEKNLMRKRLVSLALFTIAMIAILHARQVFIKDDILHFITGSLVMILALIYLLSFARKSLVLGNRRHLGLYRFIVTLSGIVKASMIVLASMIVIKCLPLYASLLGQLFQVVMLVPLVFSRFLLKAGDAFSRLALAPAVYLELFTIIVAFLALRMLSQVFINANLVSPLVLPSLLSIKADMRTETDESAPNISRGFFYRYSAYE